MDIEQPSDNLEEATRRDPFDSPPQVSAPPRRRNCFLGVLIGLAVLLLSCFVIGRLLNISLTRTERGYTVSIEPTSVHPASTSPDKNRPPTAADDASARQARSTDAPDHLGSGATLSISSSPPGVENTPSTDRSALSLQTIYEKVIPSVVSITSSLSNGAATGSGIIMSEDGYLITNCHVVQNAVTIRVLLQNNESYDAILIGGDETSDLAVLKIDTNHLTPAEFGDSEALRVGDQAVAIGDPLGTKLRGTMTDGIISGISRDLTVGSRTMTLIQTNAALNNGNSGGPLINCHGQVIGVNTMKLSSYYAVSVEGLGFAIPIATAKPIVDELIEKGYVSGRPAIGIMGETLPKAVQTYYRLPIGVYVTSVDPRSDAYTKGIAEGDIITRIGDVDIASIDELNGAKGQYSAGDVVTLTLYRDGKLLTVDITLMDQADIS